MNQQQQNHKIIASKLKKTRQKCQIIQEIHFLIQRETIPVLINNDKSERVDIYNTI